MRSDVSSHVANVALAVGVTLAVAVALGFAVAGRHHQPSRVARAIATKPPAHHAVHVARAVPPMPPHPARAAEAKIAPPPPPVRTAAISTAIPPAGDPNAPQPYDPPPPPIAAAAPVVQLASAAPEAALEQLAADSRSGDPLPGLRAVSLDIPDSHRAPARPRQKAAARSPAPPRHEPPVEATAYRLPAAPNDGPKIAGPAVVTAALELNVDGRSLRLYGIAPPKSGDLCAPEPTYAARDCADTSRQALATALGDTDFVSCRILAVGGGDRSALPAVCTDREGRDLAGYLVTHGFALAHQNEIVDYSAAERQARAQRTGLWHYR